MAGNVSEWVQDVYRPFLHWTLMICLLLSVVINSRNYIKIHNWRSCRSMTRTGRVKMVDVTDEESKNRRNYQRGNVINFLDGDSASQAQVMVMESLHW